MGVFGKKLRADRRYLSTNVNLFELGGVREEEERALMLAVEEGRLQPEISLQKALHRSIPCLLFKIGGWKHAQQLIEPFPVGALYFLSLLTLK